MNDHRTNQEDSDRQNDTTGSSETNYLLKEIRDFLVARAEKQDTYIKSIQDSHNNVTQRLDALEKKHSWQLLGYLAIIAIVLIAIKAFSFW